MTRMTTTAVIVNTDLEAGGSSDIGLPSPPRPQADALPPKPGELGFIHALHSGASSASGTPTLPPPMPERHPADRTGPATNDSASTLADADAPPPGKPPVLRRLRKVPVVAGMRATTLVRLLVHVLVFAGTIAGWALLTINLHARSTASQPPPPPPAPSSTTQQQPAATAGSGGVFGGGTTAVFVHVAFALVAIAELLFLERCLFRLRAERYCHAHPGALLPRSRRDLRRSMDDNGSDPALAFAPWNRPAVPTYAAALADAGVLLTGDVEDAAIAVPPPPAYGKTRGSMLLLSSTMDARLRAQARTARESVLSTMSERREDRPVSYVSRDMEWEEREDARRARALEGTLATLQVNTPRRSTTPDSERTVRGAE